MKRALILGIGGQDGSFLADLLLDKGYAVHGMYRRSSSDSLWRIAHIRDRVHLHIGDMTDGGSIDRIVREVHPHEIYNEADQDHVGASYDSPEVSVDVTAGAVLRLLETVRKFNKSIRVFQPCSATQFGWSDPPQSEETPMNPGSPYACAKALAYNLCRHYRRDRGVWVSTAILFNHDSERRRGNYLLHEIARSVARRELISVADPGAVVDIGYAPEFVDGIWRVMQQDQPSDYVLATGLPWPVQPIIASACKFAGLPGNHPILTDLSKVRPGGSPTLIGNPSKAKREIGWSPTVDAVQMVKRLVSYYREGAK